jgi:hypothetical protein
MTTTTEMTDAQKFILAQPRTMKAADVVHAAKAVKLPLTPNYVYAVRSDKRFKSYTPPATAAMNASQKSGGGGSKHASSHAVMVWALKALQGNLEKWAHVMEGESFAVRDSLKLKELVLSFVKLSDAEKEIVRQYFVWERTLAATFMEQSKSARDLKERIDEALLRAHRGRAE